MNLKGQLSGLLGSATRQVEAKQLEQQLARKDGTRPDSRQYSGIIFSGNRHDSVPRKLLLDDRLTPLERNAWQVFNLLVREDGVTTCPTYEELRPHLSMQPRRIASRETVAKALTVLRLTRWISLGRRVRSEVSGQVQGNVYILHDEPTSPAEALEFDTDYLQLLGQSLEHPNRAIREIAEVVWGEFAQDEDVGVELPSRVEVLTQRLAAQAWAKNTEFGFRTQSDGNPKSLSSESELSENSAFPQGMALSSDSELSGKPRGTDRVRNPNSDSTCTSTNQNVCKKDVLSDPAPWAEALNRLPAEHRVKAYATLQRVSPELRPVVIGQWQTRCQTGSVKNPLGYLLTLLQRAIQGEFNAEWKPEAPSPSTACSGDPKHPIPPPTLAPRLPADTPPRRAEDSRTARQCMQDIQQLLRPRQAQRVNEHSRGEP